VPDLNSKIKTVHVTIDGRVQGVWFRAWTQQNATARGLTGWVRNRSDGSVEALFHGLAPDVNDMVEACRKGPPSAEVNRVTPETSIETPAFRGFRLYPTV